ncbi:pyridoxamine 5'-phosphate oxidase family protein [Nocardia brasiliensis]|uniref:Pyridoxamine 5'-phosphate oxidase family protein n=1 Tax=Nocardia brasiliensis TaxID=37326 RepID=A0A6G9XVN0_NOCBR|nr:pyridoxamine 5'-phosphate oxidase family protein [Nocardia brasiliensis]QIS05031.1 pyridoxamine 5'-phosphate oxidase family protein [Nocardia brasiliensis]
MATWRAFEEEAPELAAEVKRRFLAHETHVLATLRRDGSPRVSGSEVAFHGPDLTFGSMPDARKADDLRRDGRCAIHAHPSDGDAKIAGVAEELTDPAARAAAGAEPEGEDYAFRLELTDAVLTTVDQERQLLIVRLWRPGRGVHVTERA